MLKAALTIATCLVTFSASAATFPVSPGTEYCNDNTYVSAKAIEGEDYECLPLSKAIAGKPFKIVCKGFEDEVDASAETMTITLFEDIAAGTLVWQETIKPGIVETETFVRCE